ncbi:hypothetical protein [Pontiella sp.]|uniref:hypothetical protein n=1 Tax=Pontiella sp. TaxID=2837462 RepID=UPI00356846BA
MKKIAMLLVTASAIGMLTGCGIPEEEHNMIVQNLENEHAAEVDKLNAEIASQKDLVDNEKKKVRSMRVELDDATERITSLQQKSAETAKTLASEKSKTAGLESDLKTANSRLASAEERAAEAEAAYSTLDAEHQELARRFEMYRKNMSALSAPAAPAKSTAPAAMAEEPDMMSAPKTDAEKASSLLDMMGTM